VNEATLKTAIRKLILRRGGIYVNVTGGAYGIDGAPDIVACYRGRFIGIEGKNPDNHTRLREGQEDYRDYILEAGGIHITALSLGDVEAVLDRIDREMEE
jgi:hypothetical protein